MLCVVASNSTRHNSSMYSALYKSETRLPVKCARDGKNGKSVVFVCARVAAANSLTHMLRESTHFSAVYSVAIKHAHMSMCLFSTKQPTKPFSYFGVKEPLI